MCFLWGIFFSPKQNNLANSQRAQMDIMRFKVMSQRRVNRGIRLNHEFVQVSCLRILVLHAMPVFTGRSSTLVSDTRVCHLEPTLENRFVQEGSGDIYAWMQSSSVSESVIHKDWAGFFILVSKRKKHKPQTKIWRGGSRLIRTKSKIFQFWQISNSKLGLRWNTGKIGTQAPWFFFSN